MVQVKRRGGNIVLTIGELATATGVPTSTIRFWERRELLRPCARSGGQRRYDEDALARVGLLRLCQDAGFTLAEIREMLAQRAEDPTRWRELVTAKMLDVAGNLARLNKAYDLLSHALECHHDDIFRCPTFQEAVAHRAATATDLPSLAG